MRSIVATLAVVTVACRASPGPVLESVDPGIVFDDQPAQLAIRGSFQAPVTASIDHPSSSNLEPYELELSAGGRVVKSISATFRDPRTLWAALPAGMPRGRYRARIVDPWGKDAALEDALMVAGRTAGNRQPITGGYVDPSVRVPPLADIYATPTAGDVDTFFQLDASGSTDTKTPTDLLQVSWGFEMLDGSVKWTPWTFEKGISSQLLPGQATVLVGVLDEDKDVGYAARRIFVADPTIPVCVVTTAADVDDGAQDCTSSFGRDGLLSLDEVVRLAPALKVQVVRFDIPGMAVLTGSPLRITEPIRLAGTPTLILQRELVIDSTGKVRISGLQVMGPAGKIRVENSAKLDVSDSVFSDAEPIRAIGEVDVRRTLFQNCQNQCIALTGGDGSVHVSQSSFTAGSATAIAIDLDQCPVGPEPAGELIGNVFVRFPIALHVGTNCQRAASVLHQTFYANAIGIMYEGGSQHVLRNNVFSGQAGSIAGCEFVANRGDNVLFGNAFDDCLAADQGVLRTDPLFASPDHGDFRLRWGSPLIDTAPQIGNVGIDVNGAAPGNYLGTGPDYGGRETY